MCSKCASIVCVSYNPCVDLLERAVGIHNFVVVGELGSVSIVLPAVCVSYNPCVDFLGMCAVSIRRN